MGIKGFLCQIVNLPATDKNGIQNFFQENVKKLWKLKGEMLSKYVKLSFVNVLVFGVLEIIQCVEGIVERCMFIQYMLELTSCSYRLC